MKFRTYWSQVAGSTVDVELTMDDERVAELVHEYGHETLEDLVSTGGVEPLRDLISEEAADQLPHDVCAHCAGMFGRPGIELGGEWQPDDDESIKVVNDA